MISARERAMPHGIPSDVDLVAGRGHWLEFRKSFDAGVDSQVILHDYRPVLLAHVVGQGPRAMTALTPVDSGLFTQMGDRDVHMAWHWMRDGEMHVPLLGCRCGEAFFGGPYPLIPIKGSGPLSVKKANIIRALYIVGEVAPRDIMAPACAEIENAKWWIQASKTGIVESLQAREEQMRKF